MQWRTFASKRFDRNHDCVCSEQNKNHMKIIIKETHQKKRFEHCNSTGGRLRGTVSGMGSDTATRSAGQQQGCPELLYPRRCARERAGISAPYLGLWKIIADRRVWCAAGMNHQYIGKWNCLWNIRHPIAARKSCMRRKPEETKPKETNTKERNTVRKVK